MTIREGQRITLPLFFLSVVLANYMFPEQAMAIGVYMAKVIALLMLIALPFAALVWCVRPGHGY
jgi:hypothetical protein